MPLSAVAVRNRAIKRTLYRLWGRDRRIQVLCGKGDENNSVCVIADHQALADPAQARLMRCKAMRAIHRAGIRIDCKHISFSFGVSDETDKALVTGVVRFL